MHAIDPALAAQLERAIIFMSDAWERGARNQKPTLFHCLRVAFTLLEFGYPIPYVELAVLHDILEDTHVTYLQLVQQFGKETADLVASLSHRDEMNNWEERYQEMFQRVLMAGKISVCVKAADLADNSMYLDRVADHAFRVALVQKIKTFLELTQIYQEEPVLRLLHERWKEERRRLTE